MSTRECHRANFGRERYCTSNASLICGGSSLDIDLQRRPAMGLALQLFLPTTLLLTHLHLRSPSSMSNECHWSKRRAREEVSLQKPSGVLTICLELVRTSSCFWFDSLHLPIIFAFLTRSCGEFFPGSWKASQCFESQFTM
jgi:hypothetical protein